jgi:hypothetical protein
MRNLLALLGALLLLMAGLGWYLDWFKVKTQPAAEGHHDVHIDINTTKIGQDIHSGEEKLQKMLETKDKSGPAATPDTKAAKDSSGKTGAVRLPEATGFPFDQGDGQAHSPGTYYVPVVPPQTNTEELTVPGGIFKPQR